MTDQEFEKEALLHYKSGKDFARSLLFSFEEEDIKDIVQNAYVKVFRFKEYYKPISSLKTWIFKIVKNECINFYRSKEFKRRQITERNHIEKLYNINDSFSQEEFDKLVNSLSNDYKECFKLRYVGYSYEELSELFNIPLGTVKNKLFRARKELQEKYIKRNQVLLKETYR